MDERTDLKKALEELQKLIQPDNGAQVIKERASYDEVYQALQLITALNDEQVAVVLQLIKSVFQVMETIARTLQPPDEAISLLDSEQIRTNLLALARLHRKAARDNDTLGRLFGDSTEKRVTWDDLERAKQEFLRDIPGMFLAWQSKFQLYGLFPEEDYRPDNKTNASKEDM